MVLQFSPNANLLSATFYIHQFCGASRFASDVETPAAEDPQ